MKTWQERLLETFQFNPEGVDSGSLAGPALSSSTTATSLLPAADLVTIPADYFVPGRSLRVMITGEISNIVTTPGTLTLDLRLGSVVAFNGGAMQLSATAHTTVPFAAMILLTCRSEGADTAATIIGQGILVSAATDGFVLLPATTPAVGTGFDSTVDNVLDLFGKFSISNSGNRVRVQQYTVEQV